MKMPLGSCINAQRVIINKNEPIYDAMSMSAFLLTNIKKCAACSPCKYRKGHSGPLNK